MNETERRNLAAQTADSIIDGFSTSVRRAAALFESPKEAFENLIAPEIESALNVRLDVVGVSKKGYQGETRHIPYLLGIDGLLWEEAIRQMSAIAKKGNGKMFNPGDFIILSVKVPEIKIDGYTFATVNITEARLVVTASYRNKIALNFENVLFQGPVNKECTNKGGFKASLLARYLNEHFLPSVFKEVESLLKPNCDGLKVSVPTYSEVFGNDREGYDATNWCEVGEKIRHPYFEKCTNRIKVREDDLNDTWWWWLYEPHATNANHFVKVDYSGNVNNSSANNTSGGIAPAICIS